MTYGVPNEITKLFVICAKNWKFIVKNTHNVGPRLEIDLEFKLKTENRSPIYDWIKYFLGLDFVFSNSSEKKFKVSCMPWNECEPQNLIKTRHTFFLYVSQTGIRVIARIES